MKRCRKLLSAILALCLMLGAPSCSALAEEPELGRENPKDRNAHAAGQLEDAAALDPEVRKALELEFVPEQIQGDYEKQITYAEFCAVLDAFIGSQYPECLAAWRETSANFRGEEEPMSRMEGMVVFFHAAVYVGLDAAGYEYNIPLEDLIPAGMDFYEGVTWDYPLLPENGDYYNEALKGTNYEWRNECDYWDNAKRFAECFSYGTSATYLDYDENYSLNLGDPFTRGAAIRAVERLYETSLFFEYVPLAEVSYSVPDAVIANAAKLPAASQKSLPNWHGCTVAMRIWASVNYAGMCYEEEEIRLLSEQGFNFVRVPVQAWHFFDGEDFTRVNPQALKNLDQLIEWCAEYGIHICIDLHDMPGFYTGGDDNAIDLFENKARQRLFTEFWAFFAAYYKDVPVNLLSFDLLNEPHTAGDLGNAVYADVMRPAIEAIRAANPERIIFADVIDFLNGTPVYELVDTGVAQAWHPYILNDKAKNWPDNFINGFVHKDNGTLTLNGEFPAGTAFHFIITMFHSAGELRLMADGKEVCSLSIGGEAVGENGCQYIGEEGTDGEFRNYDGLTLKAELPTSASRVELRLNGNSCWYMIDAINVETEKQTYSITGSNRWVTSDVVPALTLHDDGTVSAQDEETYCYSDREHLLHKFKALAQFREETGIQIMAQEFGFPYTISQDVTLAATEDMLSVMDELNIPWCCWCGDFAPLMDSREIRYNLNRGWDPVDVRREGSVYIPLSENWVANDELMKIYHKYMTD